MTKHVKISWTKVMELCKAIAAGLKASGYEPEVLIAVKRGGWIPARILSGILGIKEITSCEQDEHGTTTIGWPIENKRVLIVDEIADSGKCLRSIVPDLAAYGPAEIRVAVLHKKQTANCQVDFWGSDAGPEWLIYPWEAGLHD